MRQATSKFEYFVPDMMVTNTSCVVLDRIRKYFSKSAEI